MSERTAVTTLLILALPACGGSAAGVPGTIDFLDAGAGSGAFEAGRPDAHTLDAAATETGCPAGGCDVSVIVSGQSEPWGIAVDATGVYWTNWSGSVMTCPLSGCGATPKMLSSEFGYPQDIVTTAQGPCWTEDNSNGSVACPSTAFASMAYPSGIAVSPTQVFWTLQGFSTGTGTVMTSPLGGGAPTTLVSSQDNPDGLAVDATHVYWASAGTGGSGTIAKLALAGGAPTVLASGQSAPHAVAVDSANVYWVDLGSPDSADGTVMQLPIDGGTPQVLAAGQDSPFALAVDATHVYWTDTGAGTILRVPIGGGSLETVASGQGWPRGIAVDGSNVYWTNFDTGTVVKKPK